MNDVTVDHGGLSHVFSLSDHVTDGSTNVRGSYFRSGVMLAVVTLWERLLVLMSPEIVHNI